MANVRYFQLKIKRVIKSMDRYSLAPRFNLQKRRLYFGEIDLSSIDDTNLMKKHANGTKKTHCKLYRPVETNEFIYVRHTKRIFVRRHAENCLLFNRISLRPNQTLNVDTALFDTSSGVKADNPQSAAWVRNSSKKVVCWWFIATLTSTFTCSVMC